MFYQADSDGASLGSAITPANEYLDSGCYENIQYTGGGNPVTTSPGVVAAAGTDAGK